MDILIGVIFILILVALAIRFWYIALPVILLCHFLLIEKADKNSPEKTSFWVRYKKQAKIPLLIGGLIACILAIVLIQLFESKEASGWFYLMFGIGSTVILVSANPKSEPKADTKEAANKENTENLGDSNNSDSSAEKWKNPFGHWTKKELSKPGQKERYERSFNDNMKILNIDKDGCVALIMGTQGTVYDTTLNSCNCPDFEHRLLPCKHIYLLARKCKKI